MLEVLLRAFYFRHACKEYNTKKKITKKEFEFVLDAASIVPYDYGFNPWQIVVIQNPEVRQKLAEACYGKRKEIETASHVLAILCREKFRQPFDLQKIRACAQEVGSLSRDTLDLLGVQATPFPTVDAQITADERAMHNWLLSQTKVILGNMLATAAQLGIDSCPIEGFRPDSAGIVVQELGIPAAEDYKIINLVTFGYRQRESAAMKEPSRLDGAITWVC